MFFIEYQNRDPIDYLIITKSTAKMRMATIAAAMSITCKSTLPKLK